jgi:hypothetical protein
MINKVSFQETRLYVVAGVCACLAVVATGFAIIGWKRKSTKYNLVS